MKAMAITSFGKPLEMIDLDDPVPGTREVVLSVKACGVCGSDVQLVAGKYPIKGAVLPLVPGHQIVGVVETLGPEVEGWQVGDKTIVRTAVSCGDCLACRTGNERFCPDVRGSIGTTLNGGYAEKVKGEG